MQETPLKWALIPDIEFHHPNECTFRQNFTIHSSVGRCSDKGGLQCACVKFIRCVRSLSNSLTFYMQAGEIIGGAPALGAPVVPTPLIQTSDALICKYIITSTIMYNYTNDMKTKKFFPTNDPPYSSTSSSCVYQRISYAVRSARDNSDRQWHGFYQWTVQIFSQRKRC